MDSCRAWPHLTFLGLRAIHFAENLNPFWIKMADIKATVA